MKLNLLMTHRAALTLFAFNTCSRKAQFCPELIKQINYGFKFIGTE